MAVPKETVMNALNRLVIAEIVQARDGQRKKTWPLNSPQNSTLKHMDLLYTNHTDRKLAQHVAHNLFRPST